MKNCVVLMAYNRYDCFLEVFNKLKQFCLLYKIDLWVIQDGPSQIISQESMASYNDIAAFCEKDEFIHYIQQSTNYGIGLQYGFILEYFFIDLQYEAIYLFEDDLALHEQYMAILHRLCFFFKEDNRVSMISCFPQNNYIDTKEQKIKINNYSFMGHNWGFAIYKRSYKNWRKFFLSYLEILKVTDYNLIPRDVIFGFLEQYGFKPIGDGVDYIIQCGVCGSGGLRISTSINLGKPLGIEGEHFNHDFFVKMGLADNQIFSEPIPKDFCPILSDENYFELLSYERGVFLENPKAFDYNDFVPKFRNSIYKNFCESHDSFDMEARFYLPSYPLIGLSDPIENDGSVILRGVDRCNLFGPYARLEIGTYLFSFIGALINVPNDISTLARVEIASKRGQLLISEFSWLKHTDKNLNFSFIVRLDTTYTDIESRLFLSEGVVIKLNKLIIVKIDS